MPQNNHISRARKRRIIRIKRRFYVIVCILVIIIILICKNTFKRKDNSAKYNVISDTIDKKVDLPKEELNKIQIDSIDFNYTQTKTQTIISLTLVNKGNSAVINKTCFASIKNIYGEELDKINIAINYLGVGEKCVLNLVSDKFLTTIAKVELVNE